MPRILRNLFSGLWAMAKYAVCAPFVMAFFVLYVFPIPMIAWPILAAEQTGSIPWYGWLYWISLIGMWAIWLGEENELL